MRRALALQEKMNEFMRASAARTDALRTGSEEMRNSVCSVRRVLRLALQIMQNTAPARPAPRRVEGPRPAPRSRRRQARQCAASQPAGSPSRLAVLQVPAAASQPSRSARPLEAPAAPAGLLQSRQISPARQVQVSPSAWIAGEQAQWAEFSPAERGHLSRRSGEEHVAAAALRPPSTVGGSPPPAKSPAGSPGCSPGRGQAVEVYLLSPRAREDAFEAPPTTLAVACVGHPAQAAEVPLAATPPTAAIARLPRTPPGKGLLRTGAPSSPSQRGLLSSQRGKAGGLGTRRAGGAAGSAGGGSAEVEEGTAMSAKLAELNRRRAANEELSRKLAQLTADLKRSQIIEP